MNKEFHIAEYSALRSEIIECIKQISEINRFLFISLAISIGWLLSQAGQLDRAAAFVGAWIPFFLTYWFSAYRADLADAIVRLGNYIGEIEEKYGIPELGWELKLRSSVEKGRGGFRRSKRAYLMMSVFTFLFGIYYAAIYGLRVPFASLLH